MTFACDTTTPRGAPVDPDVYCRKSISPGELRKRADACSVGRSVAIDKTLSIGDALFSDIDRMAVASQSAAIELRCVSVAGARVRAGLTGTGITPIRAQAKNAMSTSRPGGYASRTRSPLASP